MSARSRELSLMNVVNGNGKARQTVVRIAGEEPFAKRVGARFVAIGERSSERAPKEIGISRIGAERLPVVDFRRERVTVRAGDKSRKIIAWLAVADF